MQPLAMQRVMIIGQPGSGKSTLARALGKISSLPVYHIDQIHWQAGWVERSRSEKALLCAAVHAKDKWIFEGGVSSTWPERLKRSDTLIWLDFPFSLRIYRVIRRTMMNRGQTRPDLPDNCPEKLRLEFLKWIWNTRNSGKEKMQEFYQSAPYEKSKYRFQNSADVDRYLNNLNKT